MFRKNKLNNIIFVIIIILLIGVGFVIFNLPPPLEENKPNQDQTNRERNELKSEIIEKKVIQNNGKGFPEITLEEGGEKMIIAIFPFTSSLGKILENPGFLVLKYDKDWRVKRYQKIIGSFVCYECEIGFFPESGLKDLNNDSRKEIIISMESLRLGGGGEIWIYTWQDNKGFVFISADDSKEGWNAFQTESGADLQFVDIENDGKIEISRIYRDYVRLGPGVNDIRIDIYKRIYKWDGTEKPYYLWKEEKIGEEKPEPIE